MKKLFSFILALMTVLAFCSCSKSADEYYSDEMKPKGNDKIRFSESADDESEVAENDLESRKIIKNVSMTVQTKNYDVTVSQIDALIKESGGYVESSEYYDDGSRNFSRNCTVVARIPSEKLDEFCKSTDDCGTVTHYRENSDDVTMNYVDIESRISSLRTEMATLTSLLEKAETLDDLLTVEKRLTEVRYELESYESRIRKYDNLIDYSTVTLTIFEVERVDITEKQGIWQEIGTNLSNAFYDIAEGARAFFVWFVSSLPYFVIIAVIAIAVILIIKTIIRKKKK